MTKIPSMNKKIIGGIIVVMVILIGAVIVVNREAEPVEETFETGLPWYEGGDLHKSAVLDWKDATYRNQLATCAAFVFFEDRDLEADEFKKRSQELRDCIDQKIYKERPVDISDQKISTLAARCSINLGHRRDVLDEQEEAKKKREEEANSANL